MKVIKERGLRIRIFRGKRSQKPAPCRGTAMGRDPTPKVLGVVSGREHPPPDSPNQSPTGKDPIGEGAVHPSSNLPPRSHIIRSERHHLDLLMIQDSPKLPSQCSMCHSRIGARVEKVLRDSTRTKCLSLFNRGSIIVAETSPIFPIGHAIS